MKFSAIILAAGSGSRTGLDYNKIFHEINGKKVLKYSIDFFRNYSKSCEIILVCSNSDFNYVYDLYHKDVDHIVIGGITRQESVFKGLNKATENYVLVHDSARPYINRDAIDRLIFEVHTSGASTLAIPVSDTIVKISGNRLIKTLDRNQLVAIQTPQAFLRELLLDAHKKALKAEYIATDDTDIVRRFTDVMPSYVLGDYRSVKLTTKDDLLLLEVIL